MEGTRLTHGVAGCVHRLPVVIVQCLLVWHLTVITVLSADPYPVFKELYQPENNVIKLQNMLLDPNTGALYVGSVNRLYKLSADLQVEDTVVTGPRQDNQACLAPPFPCDRPRETTNNVNKLLVLDDNRLIICGSIYQGSCIIRNLTNLGLLGNDSYEEVAPNTADGMSVAFVAPGPGGANVLYVASSHANWLHNRKVATLSSRVLPTENTGGDLFELLEDKENFYKWEKKIPTDLLTAFNIYYLYGFTDTMFSYFVAVQPQVATENQPEQPYYTKIAQVCQEDLSYYSYIELPLACKKGETNYNVAQSAYVTTVGSDLAGQSGYLIGEKVLFVTFSESLENKRDPTQSSAVCMYLVKKINEQFNDRRKECALGQTATTEIPWLRSPPCAPENSPADELVNIINAAGTAYCHNQDFIQPLGGNTPITAEAIYTVNSVLSAIAATGHLKETVIFLGDNRGHLQKLKVVSPTEADLYAEEAVLDQERPVVRNGVIFSPDKNYIYFMTEKKIHKIPVKDCSAYTTCDSCLEEQVGVGDPYYCGWCSLQKSCTRRRQTKCTGSEDQSNLRWLGQPAQPAQCIAILSVEPPNTPSNKRQELTLTTRGLPQLDPASSHTYQCKFKTTSQDLPLQPATVDPANSSLVRCLTPPSNKLPLMPEGFLKVNLSILATETGLDIVTTEFDFYICSAFSSCTECVGYEYKCDWCIFENKCVGNSAACDPSGIITKQQVVSNGELSCPRIVREKDQEIMIHAGVSTGFNVLAKNLPTPKSENTGYQCILDIGGKLEAVDATMINESSLECQRRIYSYDMVVNDLQVGLTVKWNNDFKIDNPDDLSVTLYKCDVNRQDCSRCLSNQTVRSEFGCRWCGSRCALMEDFVCNSVALDSNDPCPAPHLEGVDPPTGPMEGNTTIEITGTNIGRRFQDIRSVMVGRQPCDLTGLGDQYVTGKSVHCRTVPLMDPGTPQLITVTVAPVSPSDGDELTSSGDVSFTYTNPMIGGFNPIVGIEAGGTLIKVTGSNLNTGRDIRAVVGMNIPCLIIPSSGGRTLRVNGTGFSSVQVARIQVVRNGQETSDKEACSIESDWLMECRSPAVSINGTSTLTLGVLMDDFKWDGDIHYYLDPVFYELDNGQFVVSDSGNNLRIKGAMLDDAMDQTEIYLMVGSENCTITDFFSGLIGCMLPENEPPGLNADGNPDTGITPAAVVHWYGDRLFTAGVVIYPSNISTILLATIVPICGVVLLAIIVFLSCKYRRQKQLLKSYNERLLAQIRQLHEELQAPVERRRQSLGSADEQRLPIIPVKTVVLNANISIVPGDLQIKFSQLDIGKVLGQGAFGIVYQATLNMPSSGSERQVAVKTIQDTSDSRNVITFLEEGLMMKDFDHPNVLGLLGLTFDPDGQPLIVLPFMANGDLKSYIVKRKRNPRVRQLVTFALHIARGMKYLSERKFVHRDLAARNCMIDDKETAKIADFGLSRNLDESDYYTSGDKQAKLPVKWMAPESMEQKVYNMKTDVWSYGVFLWELFSGGHQPYPGVRNRDVYDFILQGRRMDPPGLSPPIISEIMQKCWKDSPKMRCTFGEIVEELDHLVAVLDDDSSPEGNPGSWNAPSEVDYQTSISGAAFNNEPGYLQPTVECKTKGDSQTSISGAAFNNEPGYLQPTVECKTKGDSQTSISGAAFNNEPGYLQPTVECKTKGGSQHIPMAVIGCGQENDEKVDVDEPQKITHSYFSN